jgi:hypothetical protein
VTHDAGLLRDDAPDRAAPSPCPAPATALQLARLVGNRGMGRLLARETLAQDAGAIVDRHTSWGRLNRAGIATEMLGLLPDHAGLFEEVFARISSNARDDVAQEIVAALRRSPDPAQRVNELAAGGGRHALLRVVRELQAGWTFDSEANDMRDLLTWLEGSTPTVPQYGSTTIEVEVITFEHGFAPLDWAGEHIFGKGARGHTAIIVGGLAYSFDEGGWEVGQTKEEYLHNKENLVRDGVGQVLDLSMEDARAVQHKLNRAANRGVYLLGGDVCSDATARALEAILHGLTRDSNPQHLRAQLAAVPLLVKAERRYHNGEPARATTAPADPGTPAPDMPLVPPEAAPV